MAFISIHSNQSNCLWPFALVSIIVVAMGSLSDCYDPLDPNGNITVTFDTYQWEDDGYSAKVTIQNFYQYRHVDQPGWKLGWIWAQNEMIWSMKGAFATKQGNCSSFKSDMLHSCVKDPEILDLMPDSSPDQMTDGCCRGGLLDAWAINPSKSFSSFQLKVGNLQANSFGTAPLNLTLMAPGLGYTCGPLLDVNPTVSLDIGGKRQVQVFRTWKTTCTYSSFIAAKTPVCCVSLSTFYNPTITACPLCSCGCRSADITTEICKRTSSPLTNDVQSDPDVVKCTDHMCPIRVHWHIMSNYVDHWRVKLTVTNYNYHKSFLDWNLLVQHPGFSQRTTIYSFNSTMLPDGFRDEVALFWGIPYVNAELISTTEDELGSVTTEMLLKKDMESFTFSHGWAFPRRLYFNGESCQMPLPDSFPTLPNGAVFIFAQPPHCLFLLLTYLTSQALLVPWL
ncbi:COBRA-like protein 1 [Argentina anserina]|uniref:COBRA-like protein 1 n=1 Tax=Argentina anserina TaxID=57926 RepID=UPI0021762A80|nr:COBRA-like protein 1 [Potentilla anserina]